MSIACNDEDREPRGIDVAADTLVALRDSKNLPSSPSRSQVDAWARRGILNRATGRRVRLPVINIGGSPHTSTEAFQWFVEESNEGGG